MLSIKERDERKPDVVNKRKGRKKTWCCQAGRRPRYSRRTRQASPLGCEPGKKRQWKNLFIKKMDLWISFCHKCFLPFCAPKHHPCSHRYSRTWENALVSFCWSFEIFHTKKKFNWCSKLTFYTAPLRLSLACVLVIDSGSPSELFHHQLNTIGNLQNCF